MARNRLYMLLILISFMIGYWVNEIKHEKLEDKVNKELVNISKYAENSNALEETLDITIYLNLLKTIKNQNISLEKDYINLVKGRLIEHIKKLELKLKNIHGNGSRSEMVRVLEQAKEFLKNDL